MSTRIYNYAFRGGKIEDLPSLPPSPYLSGR